MFINRLSPYDTVEDLNRNRSLFPFNSYEPRGGTAKYMFEYLTKAGNKRILELAHDESFTRLVQSAKYRPSEFDCVGHFSKDAKIFYKYHEHDIRGKFLSPSGPGANTMHVLYAVPKLNKATLASTRRNLAAQKIGKAMYTAWLNPYTAYGRRRLLREFNELRLGRA